MTQAYLGTAPPAGSNRGLAFGKKRPAKVQADVGAEATVSQNSPGVPQAEQRNIRQRAGKVARGAGKAAKRMGRKLTRPSEFKAGALGAGREVRDLWTVDFRKKSMPKKAFHVGQEVAGAAVFAALFPVFVFVPIIPNPGLFLSPTMRIAVKGFWRAESASKTSGKSDKELEELSKGKN
jgi:hypothetical protein